MTQKQFIRFRRDLILWAAERGACERGILAAARAETMRELQRVAWEHRRWLRVVMQWDGVGYARPGDLDLGEIRFTEMPRKEVRERTPRGTIAKPAALLMHDVLPLLRKARIGCRKLPSGVRCLGYEEVRLCALPC